MAFGRGSGSARQRQAGIKEGRKEGRSLCVIYDMDMCGGGGGGVGAAEGRGRLPSPTIFPGFPPTAAAVAAGP